MSTTIQTAKRAALTAIGSEADFREAVESFAGHQASAELTLARMVAFAFVSFHKGGDNKHWAIDHIRATIRLGKDAARRLDNCLGRIAKSEIPEGDSIAKAGLKYANDFVADFYRIETKARAAAAAKRKEAAVEKAKKAKQEADAALAAAKAEGKKEAEEDATIDVIEFTLVGENGHVEVLTPQEYMALAMLLSQMRQDVIDAETAQRKAVRLDHAAQAA